MLRFECKDDAIQLWQALNSAFFARAQVPRPYSGKGIKSEHSRREGKGASTQKY